MILKLQFLQGQTGVGKSTLLNALMPELELKTQEISLALGRGKHTTRNSELYAFRSGFIADTPGFSKIDFLLFDKRDLKALYPDFVAVQDQCKFGDSCLHSDEPGCQVRQAFDTGIKQKRYIQYRSFLEEISNQKKKY